MDLLDTDILIDVQRGHAAALAWYAGLGAAPAIPGLVALELINDAQNKRQVLAARNLVRSMIVVWPTEADCRRAFIDFAAFHLSHSLGLVDSLIAATAVGLSARLCTFNVKHFRVVPGLVLHQPYSR